MIEWAYLAADVQSGIVLAELPLSGVRFGRVLKGHGQLSGDLSLDGLSAGRRRDLLDAIDPGRRALYVAANGKLLWGGIVWKEGSDRPVQVEAQEWGSYFHRRILRDDATHTQVDQFTIANGLIDDAQLVTGGDVRVALGGDTSGVLRDRTYLAGDLHVIGERLDELSNVIDGFDYAWPAEYDDNGNPRGRLLLGYPRLGSSQPSIVIAMPRAVGFGRDASQLATTAWATGEKPTDGTDVPVATSTDPALITAGYPVLDKVNSYTTVSDAATLQEHADADQAADGGTLVTVQAAVSIDKVLDNGVELGDPALCVFEGPRFPDPFEEELRIVAMDYDPQRGECSLSLAPRVELGGRLPSSGSEQARLTRLMRAVRQLQTST